LVEIEPTQSQKELAERETLAARICVVVLQNRKPTALGRFAMPVDQLPDATGFSRKQVEAAIAWAVDCAWLHQLSDDVELRAAGIYVAKENLDLPR
jgi:hypothetical protein